MALLTFLVLNLNGTKTLMGFIRQQAGFCRTQKLKLPSLVISRRVRFACVQNTSSSDVLGRPTWEAWAPQLECLGARRAPRNFYLGDQLWGLGTLTKMLGSPKGSLKFSLEHSLELTSALQNCWYNHYGICILRKEQLKDTSSDRLIQR